MQRVSPKLLSRTSSLSVPGFSVYLLTSNTESCDEDVGSCDKDVEEVGVDDVEELVCEPRTTYGT